MTPVEGRRPPDPAAEEQPLETEPDMEGAVRATGPERWLPRDPQHGPAGGSASRAEAPKPKPSATLSPGPSRRLARRDALASLSLGTGVTLPLWCVLAVPSLLIGVAISVLLTAH